MLRSLTSETAVKLNAIANLGEHGESSFTQVHLVMVIVLMLVFAAAGLHNGEGLRLRLREESTTMFDCPISGSRIRDPVRIVQSGATCDREWLCWHLAEHPTRCPCTGQQFGELLDYIDNDGAKQLLIEFHGEDAFLRFDDTGFLDQYALLSNVPIYENIASRLYGLGWQKIDWLMAQRMSMTADQEDSIIVGFKALLLHPGYRGDDRLEKDEGESLREWERAKGLGLLKCTNARKSWAQWLRGMFEVIVNQDYDSKTVKDLFQPAARRDHALALCSLGVIYDEDGAPEWAEYYYELSAEYGHALAQYNLAMRYEEYERMRPYLEKASAQGHSSALFDMGTYYLDSDVRQQDHVMARYYFEQAAKRGHTEAKDKLVELFIEQALIPIDDRMAIQVLELAAEQRDPRADFNLGLRYHFGIGVEQNHERAREHYKLAAEQNHSEAQMNLNLLNRAVPPLQ